MGIEILRDSDLDSKLQKTFRHYLVGKFSEASLKDDNIEVGVSHYKEFTVDKPHYHPDVTEYQLVLSGKSMLYDLKNQKQYVLTAGDFFIVRNNTHYVEKHKPNTRVLFFKNPGINDKILLPIDQKIKEWSDDEDF